MKKKNKLTAFEKRVRDRHKRQEKEFGRDEFLFGVDEEDETVDIEYGEDTDPGVEPAVGDDPDMEDRTGNERDLTPDDSGIGNTTAIIADEIIAAQLSALATEMSGDGAEENDEDSDFYTDEIPAAETEAAVSVTVGTETEESGDLPEEEDDEDSDFYTDEIPAAETEAAVSVTVGTETEESGDLPEEEDDEDSDFYTDEIPAAVAAMAEAEEAAAIAEAEMATRRKSSGTKSRLKSVSGSGSKRVNSRKRKKPAKEEEDTPLVGGIASFLTDMSVTDRLIVVTGICVLIVAIISGSIFVNARTIQKQVAEFGTIGGQTAGIYVVGESGLNAAVSARAGYLAVSELEQLPEEEPEVVEEIVIEDKVVQIVMKVASVQSDLKIKFSNKDTGKLISGVAFAVTVTSDAGKEYKWSDDNKDGLIYHTDVPNGTYSVVMEELPEEEKDNYLLPSNVSGVKVTDKIEYKKVDVADEVKSEAEVNVAAEDTAVQDTAIESQLADTVEWVESTKTLISGSDDGYMEIDKGSISLTTSRVTVQERDLVVETGIWQMPVMSAEPETTVVKLMAEGEESGETIKPGGDDSTSENTDQNTNEEDESGDSSKTEEEKKDDEESGGDAEVVSDDNHISSVSISSNSISLKVGDTYGLKASARRENGDDGGTVSWWSSDESIATVSDGTVTAVSKGTATITAISDMDGSKSASCKVTVSDPDEKTDNENVNIDSPKLKDSSGNQVYIKNSSGEYVPATQADYDSADKFYIKTTGDNAVYMYTGWQTIDGNTYFFDKNGNYVTGEQIIQGARYTFNSDGHLSTGSGTMGIDVSKWNGSIDWNAVKNAGVSYVIIRCGYRGSSTGALIEDPKFRANISGAKAAGLAVGAYFFTQAVNEVEAVEEASMAASLCGGYGLSLPIFLDVESSGGRGDSIGADMRTAVVKAFCQTVRNSGYAAGVYANKTWFTEKMHISQLTSYKIWLAQYAASPTYTASRYDYWQYSSKGKISGISGNVDLNIRY